MSTALHATVRRAALVPLCTGALLVAAGLGVALLAPREATMGDTQRIVYVHVAVAWCSLVGLLAAAGTGLLYLLRRHLVWDHWAQTSAELGWLCATLTLITGAWWAKAAWGTWWTWEPRLTTAFILWCLYSGYLIARHSIEQADRRARLSAVFAIVGALDVPLVIAATRLFRGMHPVSPTMEPSMRLVLWLNVAGYSLLFAWLAVQRRRQLECAEQLLSLESRLPTEPTRRGGAGARDVAHGWHA